MIEGSEVEEVRLPQQSWRDLSSTERRNLAMLFVLYTIQALPLGLVSGTLPLLLKSTVSYSELGVLSLCYYPFSLKLLWSPVVDAVYSTRIGRRKTWIIATQLVMAVVFLLAANYVQEAVTSPSVDIQKLTAIFFLLVLLAATQDIAVDGWALILVEKRNLSYASTCEALGMQMGYQISYPLFIALNSPTFCAEYLNIQGAVLDIGLLLRLCAFAYLAVTIALYFKTEAAAEIPKDLSIKMAYRQLGSLFTLPGIKHYLVVGMLFKIGFVANESISMLELVDRGFRREQLAFTAVIDFPSQVLIGLVTLNFSKNLKPWLLGQGFRLSLALLSIFIVWQYSTERAYLFPLIVALHLAITFAATCMFVSSGAFFNRISDPAIGGMYITFLNTVSNVGGTWPKWFVFSAVDMATVAYCKRPSSMFWDETMPCRHVSDCASGSVCETIVDGYYIVAAVSFLLGVMILAFVVLPKTAIMESLPLSSWRIPKHLYS
eukprot:m.390360 g.390360  ORF g.390360 m.390360 type:complete len:490 (+) comp56342_c0_seq5:201-1670(+)